MCKILWQKNTKGIQNFKFINIIQTIKHIIEKYNDKFWSECNWRCIRSNGGSFMKTERKLRSLPNLLKKTFFIDLVWTFITNIQQSYFTENTLFSIITTNNFILHREIIDMYCVNDTKLKYIMWRSAEACLCYTSRYMC
jgi:hypothetical protein